MEVQLKKTISVVIEMPDYFCYSRYSQTYYCRVIDDKIIEVGNSIIVRTAKSVIDELKNVESCEFSRISKEEYIIKINEFVQSITSEQ